MNQPASAPRRPGRPSSSQRASSSLRERILSAARTEFAAHGYGGTSARRIAQEAGVDAALVRYYFGNKEQVYATAVGSALQPAFAVAESLAADSAVLGERLAQAIFGTLDDPQAREPLIAMVRSALDDEHAATVLRNAVSELLLCPRRDRIPLRELPLRAELAAAHVIGVIMLRYILGQAPLATAELDSIVAAVAPTLQHYIAGPTTS